uniref:Uncharacterized protein n=1 Tax=Nelumbo nucifera TaxID=4432 RepID=A0A822XMV9_NELNU|nr:TPA_asm: hypothetical protein HUJ06_024408 [Nelumbo nucifera]
MKILETIVLGVVLRLNLVEWMVIKICKGWPNMKTTKESWT